MQRDARKYLYDIDQAAALIAQFTAGKSFARYVEDRMADYASLIRPTDLTAFLSS